MKQKKALITGIGGFIGSHTMEHLLVNTDWHIVGIDSWQHKGIPERITESEIYQKHKDRVRILTHDLSTPLTWLTKREIGLPEYIFNIASESHVDRSISDPVPFVQNNVNLALTMLEFAREVKPEIFFQISTDEVYGAAPKGHNHKEWESMLPSNPYSASKAAQEAIAISYWRTYGVPVVITNTMNNFGEGQDQEKFVSQVIAKTLRGETITIHGSPNKIGSRYYLHARNHADALLFLANYGKPVAYPDSDRPARYNIVGEREYDNLEMAKLITTILDKPLKFEWVDFHSTRPGHDLRYALDGTKLKDLGWTPPFSIEQSMKKTIEWTLAHPKWI